MLFFAHRSSITNKDVIFLILFHWTDSTGPPATPRLPPTSRATWRPLDYGNPLDRDPTFDYAPPAVERVRFISEARNRRPTARAHTGLPLAGAIPGGYNAQNRPPPPPPSAFRPGPSLWKMLAHKQRPKRPFPHPPPPHHHHRQPVRYHGQSPDSPLYHHQAYHDQAEVFPRIPNIVYFKPTDVVSKRPGFGPGPLGHHHHAPHPGRPTKTGDLKPGSVSDASLYSGEMTAHSEFKPVAVVKPTVGGSKEYIFTVVGYKGPSSTTTPISIVSSDTDDSGKSHSVPVPVVSQSTTTKRTPTILHAVKTTPVTISSTHNSAVKPFEPTESLATRNQLKNHKNHRNEEDEIEESGEETSIVEEVLDHKDNDKQIKRVPGGILDVLDMVPPAPLFPIVPNSFNILDSNKQEDDSDEDESQEQKPEINANNNSDAPRRPVFNAKNPTSESYKTSTSVSISVSKDEIATIAPATKTTTTASPTSTKSPRSRPTTTRRTVELPSSSTPTTTSTTTEPSSTTESSTTPKPTKFPRLPTMPTYKKKTPVYARKHKNMEKNSVFGKYSSASSSSALSKEINGSGEIVVITAGRSKVKEYKPQFIADNSQLLSFDKVADTSSTASSVESTTPSPSTTTAKSPLQEFDPMQLLHSWFTKSDD
jgi:hypothetical protein